MRASTGLTEVPSQAFCADSRRSSAGGIAARLKFMLGRGKAHFGCTLVLHDAERLEPHKRGDEVVRVAVNLVVFVVDADLL